MASISCIDFLLLCDSGETQFPTSVLDSQQTFSHSTDPMKWTTRHVGQWLDWAVQEFGFNTVDKSNFQLTGIQLCALSREDFLKQAPPYTGDVLYSHLNLLKAKGVRGRSSFGGLPHVMRGNNCATYYPWPRCCLWSCGSSLMG